MAYRIYCLDGVNRFITAEWVEADDDEHALTAAAALPAGVRREVWHYGRLVGRIDLDPGENSD